MWDLIVLVPYHCLSFHFKFFRPYQNWHFFDYLSCLLLSFQTDCLRTSDLSNPTLSRQIAQKLAQFHTLDMPLCKEPRFITDMVDKYVHKYYTTGRFKLWRKTENIQSVGLTHIFTGERGGSVVECRTPEREVRGSRPTAAVLCPWARHFTPRKYWLITQEAMAPSRHDWKIVDWDVKPQHNQHFYSSKLEMRFNVLIVATIWTAWVLIKPNRRHFSNCYNSIIWYIITH